MLEFFWCFNSGISTFHIQIIRSEFQHTLAAQEEGWTLLYSEIPQPDAEEYYRITTNNGTIEEHTACKDLIVSSHRPCTSWALGLAPFSNISSITSFMSSALLELPSALLELLCVVDGLQDAAKWRGVSFVEMIAFPTPAPFWIKNVAAKWSPLVIASWSRHRPSASGMSTLQPWLTSWDAMLSLRVMRAKWTGNSPSSFLSFSLPGN